MKTLVTGGAGFIGSNLARFLLEQGHEVRVFDDLSTGRMSNLAEIRDQIDFIEGDLRSQETVTRALNGIEAVYHQGAIPSVPKSFAEPMLFHEVNVSGTLCLYLAAIKAGARRIVFASSSSVYGDSEVEPKVESLPTSPLSPYAITKLAGELYGTVLSDNTALEVVSLRYFNVYGPRQALESGYAAVIPSFLTSILKDEPLTVFGTGEQTRDFTFVEDAARANVLAMETPEAAGDIFNVSGNCAISLNRLIEVLRELLPDRDVQVRYEPPRPGDILHSRADVAKAKRVMGYEPITGLEDGLRRSIRYYAEEIARRLPG